MRGSGRAWRRETSSGGNSWGCVCVGGGAVLGEQFATNFQMITRSCQRSGLCVHACVHVLRT